MSPVVVRAQVLGVASCVCCAAAASWGLYSWSIIHFVYDYRSLGWAIRMIVVCHLLAALGIVFGLAGLSVKQQRGKRLARIGLLLNSLFLIVFWLLGLVDPFG